MVSFKIKMSENSPEVNNSGHIGPQLRPNEGTIDTKRNDQDLNNTSIFAMSSKDEVSKGGHEVALLLNLFSNGFHIVTDPKQFDKVKEMYIHPYERPAYLIFTAVEHGRLPGNVCKQLGPKFTNGSFLCEVRDFRSQKCSVAGLTCPIVHQVLLQMSSNDNVWSSSDRYCSCGFFLGVGAVDANVVQSKDEKEPEALVGRTPKGSCTKKIDLGIDWIWRKRKQSVASTSNHLQVPKIPGSAAPESGASSEKKNQVQMSSSGSNLPNEKQKSDGLVLIKGKESSSRAIPGPVLRIPKREPEILAVVSRVGLPCKANPDKTISSNSGSQRRAVNGNTGVSHDSSDVRKSKGKEPMVNMQYEKQSKPRNLSVSAGEYNVSRSVRMKDSVDSAPTEGRGASRLEKFAKIVEVTERYNLDIKRQKVDKLITEKQNFPASSVGHHLNIQEEKQLKCTAENGVSLAESIVDKRLNYSRTRTMEFIVPSFASRGNEVSNKDNHARIEVIFSEEYNGGAVEAIVLYRQANTKEPTRYQVSHRFTSAKLADVFADQFTTLVFNQGYKKTRDQVVSVPIDSSRQQAQAQDPAPASNITEPSPSSSAPKSGSQSNVAELQRHNLLNEHARSWSETMPINDQGQTDIRFNQYSHMNNVLQSERVAGKIGDSGELNNPGIVEPPPGFEAGPYWNQPKSESMGNTQQSEQVGRPGNIGNPSQFNNRGAMTNLSGFNEMRHGTVATNVGLGSYPHMNNAVPCEQVVLPGEKFSNLVQHNNPVTIKNLTGYGETNMYWSENNPGLHPDVNYVLQGEQAVGAWKYGNTAQFENHGTMRNLAGFSNSGRYLAGINTGSGFYPHVNNTIQGEQVVPLTAPHFDHVNAPGAINNQTAFSETNPYLIGTTTGSTLNGRQAVPEVGYVTNSIIPSQPANILEEFQMLSAVAKRNVLQTLGLRALLQAAGVSSSNHIVSANFNQLSTLQVNQPASVGSIQQNPGPGAPSQVKHFHPGSSSQSAMGFPGSNGLPPNQS